MSTPAGDAPARPVHRPFLSTAALALAILAIVLVGIGGPGTRFGWWHFRTGFTLMKYGAYLGVAAVVVALIAAILSRRALSRTGFAVALLALVIGLTAWFLPWNWRRGAGKVPPIHDITTDTRTPPPLVFSRAMRDSVQGMNPWEYEGDSIAALQRKAYPDVQPVMLAMTPDSAFGVAYQAARDMGWTINDVRRDELTVEASDVTGWYGFVDDVVIRVTPASGIARVDVRSVSRVGRSDIGMNAKRIRRYIAALKAKGGEAAGG
ncbi:MAG TPA: DUF1499 domain-containing protein [Longimicrobium sp.]|nr:DUF1499 domain-containing protein [Longimicrobium sp.]